MNVMTNICIYINKEKRLICKDVYIHTSITRNLLKLHALVCNYSFEMTVERIKFGFCSSVVQYWPFPLGKLSSIMAASLGLLSCYHFYHIFVEMRLKFSSNMSCYIASLMIPLMTCSATVSFAEKKPNIKLLPPPCITVDMLFLETYILNPSFLRRISLVF